MKLWDELSELIQAIDTTERKKFKRYIKEQSLKTKEILEIALSQDLKKLEDLRQNNKNNVVTNRLQRAIDTTHDFIISIFPRVENHAIRLIQIHRALFFNGLYDQARNKLAEAVKYCLKYQLWPQLNECSLCIDQAVSFGNTHPLIFNQEKQLYLANLSIYALQEENEYNKLYEEIYSIVFDRTKPKNVLAIAEKYKCDPMLHGSTFISYRSQARHFNIRRLLDLMISDYHSYAERSHFMADVYNDSPLLKEVHFYGFIQAQIGACDGYVHCNQFDKYLEMRQKIEKSVMPNQRLKTFKLSTLKKVDLKYFSICNAPFETFKLKLKKIEDEILKPEAKLSLQTKTFYPLLFCSIFIKYGKLEKADFWLNFYKDNREIHAHKRKDIHRLAIILRILLNFEKQDIDKCNSDCNNAIRNIKQYGFVYESEEIVVKFFRNAVKQLHNKKALNSMMINLKDEIDTLTKKNIQDYEYKVKYFDWPSWCNWKLRDQ